MKKYCINLKSRQDRKDLFLKNNGEVLSDVEFFEAYNGYSITYSELKKLNLKPNHNWIDPTFQRRLTKGEIGCLASHVALWKKCLELNENILILEDDCVISSTFDENKLELLLRSNYNLAYLGYNEMSEVQQDLGSYVVPGFAYQTHAYGISPKGAQILLDGLDSFGGIPADELLSKCFDTIKPIAFKPEVATQLSRRHVGTDVECHGDGDLFPFEKLKVFTVATDKDKAHRLINSCNHYKIDLNVLGENLDAFDMSSLGGGIKVNLLREALNDCDDDDLILFLDGYDTFIAHELTEIHQRFLAMNAEIVFSAELVCWPDEHLASEFESETRFKYLNSGTFIGHSKSIKEIIKDPIDNTADDQRHYTLKYLQNKNKFKLDTECYIFQTNFDNAEINDNMIYNPETKCFSCIYHGNGGNYAIPKLDELYLNKFKNKTFSINKGLTFLKPEVKEQLDTDMYTCSFLSKEMCNYLIDLGDKNGNWEPLPGDKFPAQEIRVGEIGLWQEFSDIFDEEIGPLYESLWFPIQHYGLRDAFLMRYAVDTQRDLPLHHDASLVTGSVKLNDAYTGARLYYPRQDVCNTNVPVGDMILFPGQVTHGHTCERLLSGVKYSLTFWTKRSPNDP